jgi:hypothetical protein
LGTSPILRTFTATGFWAIAGCSALCATAPALESRQSTTKIEKTAKLDLFEKELLKIRLQICHNFKSPTRQEAVRTAPLLSFHDCGEVPSSFLIIVIAPGDGQTK